MLSPTLRRPIQSARLEIQLKEVEKHFENIKQLVDKNYTREIQRKEVCQNQLSPLENQLGAITKVWQHLQDEETHRHLHGPTFIDGG